MPEKKGLLGKFAGKKDSTQKPLFGGGAKLESAEPAPEKPYDPAALDSIGTKGFDKSALDSIGTRDFDKGALDAIGTKGFDKSALDSIGTKDFDKGALDAIGTKGFDKSALDSIGTKDFDKGALDAIGTKGVDKGALDAIGDAAPATPEGKDKAPKGGGLLGGKFGQKAKASGGDKLKVGGINPPSVDPNFDQKETGRFMVNQSELDALGSSQSLTPEPAQDFSSAASALPPEMDLSASSAVSEEAPVDESAYEHTPVIGADEVGRLITDADNAYRLRQFKAAEPIFANVLDKLDKTGDDSDPLLPYCLDKMSDNLYQLKKYNEALQYLRRLLVLHTKISSEDRDMISTLYKIAQCCEALSLTSEADSMYKRAFRLGQQSLVPGDPLLAKVLEGYGTMLMRSEGAEPPAGSSEKSEEAPTKTPRSAEVQSALSAEEIAMLNSLGASSERSSAEPSPIILSGGPTGASEQSSGKSRSPLKQSDERADKVRATTGPVGGSTAGGVWVRLGIFLSVIVGLVLVTLNIKTDYTSHHVAHSKGFVKRVYKSADGGATFTISSEDEAAKDNFGKHFVYEYRDWNGTPSDDLEVISGQVNGDNFIYEIPQGIKDGSGAIFFEPHASELTVTAKMHELGNKAQTYFKSKGKYPDGKDLQALAKSVDYKNPFTQTADSISAAGIAWPPSLDATQLLMKSSFDTSMENGDLWEGEAAPKPGLISAASASQKQPDASVFYIHGRDRDGKLITRADGKVYVLIYKNGIDVTPGAADFKNEKPGPGPAPMRLSKKDGSITATTIILSYLPVAFFLILALVFLTMLNKGSGRIGRFSVPTFG
ncbi:MAG: tetratricopeptide repeat protein [Candidatus Obscuribacterales bacterium]